MKILKSFILFICFISLAKEPDLKWKNFSSGLVEAKKSNKIILVDVYTDWCKWCKEMDKNTYANDDVIKYLNKNFVVVKLNAEGSDSFVYNGKKYSSPDLSQYFNVDGYPATLFLKSNGDIITLLPGYNEAPMFLKVLSFINEEKYKTMDFDKYIETKK